MTRSSLRLLDAQHKHVQQIPHCNAACSLPSSAGASFLLAAQWDGTTMRIANMPGRKNLFC
jgi:hypothetical protein